MRYFLARAGVVVASVWVAALGCNSRTATPPAKHSNLSVQTAPRRAPAVVDDRKTLGFLASDELEGRGIGTAGLDRAADFLAAEFNRVGLRPLPGQKGYFQPLEMTTATEIGPDTSLRVADRTFEPREDYTPIAFSAQSKFAGGVVFVGYGITSDEHHYDDYAGVDAKGKVVLAMRYEPRDEKGKSKWEPDGWSDAAAVSAKAKTAKAHGATALLLVTPPTAHQQEDRLLGLAQRPANEKPDIPIVHVKQTVAEELLRRAGAPDLETVEKKIDQAVRPASFALPGVEVSGQVQLVQKRVAVKNVLGYVPGKHQDEYVVVGAHYDHLGRGGIGSLSPKSHEIHNGADDNASGTTAVLMLAARFAAGEPPERSIIFAAFTGEEEGLVGSDYFVKHPPVPLSKIVAMLNLDMVGRIRTASQLAASSAATQSTTSSATAPATREAPGVLYIGGSGTAASFDAIVKKADADSPLVVKDMGKGGIGPSDHMSFALKKIPVLFLFSGLHPDYHRPTDDADKINYRGVEEVADFAQDLLAQIAAMPKQQYVDAADASAQRVGMGSPSGGSRVTLGVVPDYSSFDQGGGVRISGTSPGSPAAAAGLKGGDVIVKFNDKPIDNLYDLSDVLAAGKPGQQVKLKVLRDGGKEPIEIDATLAERKG